MKIADIDEFVFDGRKGRVTMLDSTNRIVRWNDGAIGGGPTNVDEMIAAGRLQVISRSKKENT